MIFCLMGPTASGKTDLALRLAAIFPLEIVSVDSVMVYRGMNIGSAKPDAATLASVPHHLIDIRDPWAPYSAAQFCVDALCAIEDILRRGRVPLLAGGTMLYFRALQQGLSGLPAADLHIRQLLTQQAQTTGWPALHEQLQQVDAKAAARIHPHDSQRIQRALEVFMLTGQSMSVLQTENAKKNTLQDKYRLCNIVIAPTDRSCLHERIARRFVEMLAAGLIEEVDALLSDSRLSPDMPSMRSAGYRQVCAYLNGEITRDALTERGIIATRQLAKRQLTWLRHWPDTICVDSESSSLINDVSSIIRSEQINH